MIDFTGNYHSGGAVILPAFYVTEIRAPKLWHRLTLPIPLYQTDQD